MSLVKLFKNIDVGVNIWLYPATIGLFAKIDFSKFSKWYKSVKEQNYETKKTCFFLWTNSVLVMFSDSVSRTYLYPHNKSFCLFLMRFLCTSLFSSCRFDSNNSPSHCERIPFFSVFSTCSSEALIVTVLFLLILNLQYVFFIGQIGLFLFLLFFQKPFEDLNLPVCFTNNCWLW